MERDELGLRMVRQNAVPSFKQFRIAGEIFAMKEPIRMVV
jgi:hypothetical protein